MGNEEKLKSLTLSFSQTASAGRLMGQDLLQMVGQGFNPLQIISENTGISMADLKKKMEDGAISSGMVEEAFRLATSEGGRYYDMSTRMAESAGGKFSTMMGTFQNTIGRVGMKFAEWIKPMFDIGTSVIKNIIPFGKAVLGVLKYVAAAKPLLFFLATAVGAVALSMGIAKWNALMLTYALGGLNFSFMQATWAGQAFNFVMNMNPLARMIMIIGAVIAVVWTLWNRFESFRGVVMGTWEVMKGFGSAIKNYVINRFSELLAGVQGIGSALAAFFKGDFTKAFEIGKKAAGDLLGVNSKKTFVEDGIKAVKSFNTGFNKGVKMNAPEVALKATSPKTTKDPFKQKESSLFAGLKDGTGKGAGGKDKKDKSNADSIVSGGNKMTSITINIEKLQDDTKIYVSSVEQGLNGLGDKVQEMILRAVNSVNQMQTN
jgi:tape measure domain-containing protein